MPEEVREIKTDGFLSSPLPLLSIEASEVFGNLISLILELVTKHPTMTIQSVFHLEHHSDHWSTTSGNHHHVDRALHPVTVELVKWVCFLQYFPSLETQEASSDHLSKIHSLLSAIILVENG